MRRIMKKAANILIWGISILLMATCNGYGISEHVFPTLDVQIDEFNSNIGIEPIQHLNSYKIGDDLVFDVVNYTDAPIQIMPDNDIKIFQWQVSNWTEINNHLNYLSIIEMIPTKKQDPLGVGSLMFSAIPDIVIDSKPITIRVIVIATICDKEGNPTPLKAGAYVDFNISP